MSKGSLEDYLPTGYRAKDLEKLIAFIASPPFWDELPEEGKAELSEIAKLVLQIGGEITPAAQTAITESAPEAGAALP